jgi:hypothetical protein
MVTRLARKDWTSVPEQCEAGDLAESDSLGLDLVEGLTAVEHGFVEPALGPLPAVARVDCDRVEDDR